MVKAEGFTCHGGLICTQSAMIKEMCREGYLCQRLGIMMPTLEGHQLEKIGPVSITKQAWHINTIKVMRCTEHSANGTFAISRWLFPHAAAALAHELVVIG